MISLQNVSRIIDGEHILQNINWDMENGENWVLFGLNGSGKTMLLNIMMSDFLGKAVIIEQFNQLNNGLNTRFIEPKVPKMGG
ncbi:MAG TPA: ATP-binding cassette domain-containing protein [Bacillus bacterium]|nr:ATP-binding cassette domain-containing protein [Bacillus sp. (in: firmicutes)]